MAISSTAESPAVVAHEVSRSHGQGNTIVHSLRSVSFSVWSGEVVAVMGPSGSGKTTLLHLLGGLDIPDGGRVVLAGTDWSALRGDARAAFRRTHCGFVLQGFSLLPQATAAENVELPLLLDGIGRADRTPRVLAALETVELADQAPKLPDQLSGGQQQRVAIARAVVTNPAVIFADEPTGNLDSKTARTVVALLVNAARENGAAVILVTHDPMVAGQATRILTLRSGRLEPPDQVG